MVLIVEDNKDVNQILKEALVDAGYDTESVYDGIAAMKFLKEKEYDLVLLDLMLPYRSGDQILAKLREFSTVPVIVISAKDMVGTKVDLLKLGADDYVTKPFDLDEVVARVESIIRRFHHGIEKTQTYTFHDLVIEEESRKVSINKQEIELTSKEYLILETMIKNPSKVFTKANLYESIWGEPFLGDDNTIKTHMSNLRNKLKKACSDQEYIETVWGLGFRMKKN